MKLKVSNMEIDELTLLLVKEQNILNKLVKRDLKTKGTLSKKTYQQSCKVDKIHTAFEIKRINKERT